MTRVVQNTFLALKITKKPQKIMIIGRPGGGKSTFALKLKEILKLPLYHLDKYFYVDNWQPRDYQAFLETQQQFVDSSTWIIDGNSTKSYENRYAKADLCLYFNFPRYQCYWRIFKRLFHKHPDIDDRAENCKETIRWSLITYMWHFEDRVNSITRALQQKYPNVLFIEIRNMTDLATLEMLIRKTVMTGI